MTHAIQIVAVGSRTPLGLRSAPAAAAVRAGISGLDEHPFMIDCVGDPMPGALDAELDPTLLGPERLLALAETALREACEPLAERRSTTLQLPVFLGLSEIRPGFSPQDAENVRFGLGQFDGLPSSLSETTVFAEGHAAGLSALAAASEQMRQGAFEACLVGGVDSYFHPDTMEWLDANRQLANSVSRSGFVPGEGAAFCLLMTEELCKRLALTAWVKVKAAAVGKETKLIKTAEMCLGEGLSATIRNAVDHLRLPDERINQVFCDINGERYRSEEWGFVCLRLSHFFDDPTAYVSPADCWGDIGAASGPALAMLFCQSIQRGYSKGSRALLWGSSESGQRSCVVLESVARVE